jgi:uncharacterized protein (TIGR03086 family)
METKTDIRRAYARTIEQALRVVQGVGPEQLELATPCRAWNARELLNHLVGSNVMMAEVGCGKSMGEGISGTDAVDGLGDLIGDSPADAYASTSSSALRAFTAPGALDRPWRLPFAEMPGAAALNIHVVETLAHTWDLAKTTGQLGRLDPELAEIGEALARGFVQPEFRNAQGDPFAAEVAVPVGAPAYARLAGFLGRTP